MNNSKMELESVHNYYERLVFNEIKDNYLDGELNGDKLTDMACLALNEIKPRYIRHDIDMSFFMTSKEFNQVHKEVKIAVQQAYEKLVSQQTSTS